MDATPLETSSLIAKLRAYATQIRGTTALPEHQGADLIDDAADALEKATDFGKWYSEEWFSPLSDVEIKQIGELIGPSVMSRLHAGWGRHLAKVARGEI